MKNNKQFFGSAMLLVASVFWGLSYSVQSLCSNLTTFTIIFFKTIGGLVLLIIAIIKKDKFDKTTIIGGIEIGVTACIGITLQQKGLELSSAANASFLTVLYIVFTPIISIFIGKKPKPRIIIAIVIALVGMYFLCIKGEFILRLGDILLIIGSVFFALQTILIDKYTSDADPIAFTAIQQLTSALIAASIVMVVEKPAASDILSSLPQIIFLCFVSGAGAQLIQTRFQQDVNPSLCSIIMSFESVFGAIFGWLILNQALSTREIMGCALMFIAILIAE